MSKLISKLITNFNDPAFVRYLIIGVLSFLIDLGLFNVLHFLLGTDLVPSNMTSLLISMIFNYVATNYWTFKATDGGNKAKISRYVAISIFNYIVNNIIFYILAGVLLVPANLAKIMVISMQVSWTFLIYKFWVFK